MRAKAVAARMGNRGRAVDMVDTITVEFENGALGLVGGTGTAKALHRVSLAVFCEQGAFLADTLSGYTGVRRSDGTYEELNWDPVMNTRYGTTHNFLDVVLGRAPSFAPGEAGWRAVEVLDAADRSARKDGQPVLVEDLYQ